MRSGLAHGAPAPARAQNADALEFFERVTEAFVRAEQAAAGLVDRFYAIGGFSVRLRFAGPALVPFIVPAFEHLATGPCPEPALTVYLWDSTSTGVEMPPPPWASDDYVARGAVRGYSSEQIKVAFHLGPCVLNMLDLGSDLGVLWVRDAHQVPDTERAAPLRTILHWWMRERGCQLIHAAAVGKPGGGVLIAGKSGSGKSTVALACLASELLYLSDDLVLLCRNPTPHAHSVYNSAKLEADHARRLRHLRSVVDRLDQQDTEKAIFFLHQHLPERVGAAFPVRAVLLPHITRLPETRLSAASGAASLMALAPSTLFQLPGSGSSDFKEIAEFVRQVPCYMLEVGTDLGRVPSVLLDLLPET
jgi:hypothetical protein